MRLISFVLLAFVSVVPVWAKNTTIPSFKKAKEIALNQIYYDHRETLYCGATFDENKTLMLPDGFKTEKYIKRANRLEWEHVVPAENFGRAFVEWREGNPKCVDTKGKFYKGRKCAENYGGADFQQMQADLYNLYPVVGAVNALRSNYDFVELPQVEYAFGTCAMKILKPQVEPPDTAKGIVARTYLYMDAEYHDYYQMTLAQKKLMQEWDEKFPPDEWECERAKRIHHIQGNENKFVERKC